MAEYNPSKIIKDGNTYNFRDTTKIPLAGSNQISGDLIPSTNGTVNLGGVSYQWNNAYIKSLTINGVACGDILTHNVSEFVDVSTAQTIGGVKTFSNDIRINKASPRLQMKSTTYSSETSSAMTIGEIAFLNNNGGFSSWILDQLRDNLTKRLCFRVYPHDGSAYKGFAFDDSCNLYPENTNSALGTSTNKWKSFNGLNPGALSLPSVSSGINLDLTNFKTDGSDNKFRLTSFSNYPYDNGWLFVRLNGCTSYYLDHWYKVVSDSYATPSEAIFFLPINDKDHDITLRCVCTSINYIRIFPCQGNV